MNDLLNKAAKDYMLNRLDGFHHDALIESFIAGASWREQQAVLGLQEWWESVAKEAYRTKPTLDVEKTWQASQLSSAKLLAEKDKEIEALGEYLTHWKDACDEIVFLHTRLQEAKELIREMRYLIQTLKASQSYPVMVLCSQFFDKYAEKIKALLGEE